MNMNVYSYYSSARLNANLAPTQQGPLYINERRAGPLSGIISDGHGNFYGTTLWTRKRTFGSVF